MSKENFALWFLIEGWVHEYTLNPVPTYRAGNIDNLFYETQSAGFVKMILQLRHS